MTVAVLKAYLDGRATTIASEHIAERAVQLFTSYLTSQKNLTATAAFWTPSQQFECAKWLRTNYTHSPATIARLFNVMRSAFLDAEKTRLRPDAIGNMVEAALMRSAPKIVMTQDAVAAELKVPTRSPRRATLSIEQMAEVLDSLKSPHLFRFAILELTTWARPQAIIDFNPDHQIDWNDGTLDLAPLGWVQTKKRRPRQPLTQCLEGWVQVWTHEDRARNAKDAAEGRAPREAGLLVYKRKRVACVKKAFRRIGADLGLVGFSQYSFRHFMADQIKKQFRGVPREMRSRWLGHVVRDGSRTTDNYESDDPLALVDVALATDSVIALVAQHAARPLFAIEPRLNRSDLKAIGARVMPKAPDFIGKSGGRDRDRTCDPFHVKEVLFR